MKDIFVIGKQAPGQSKKDYLVNFLTGEWTPNPQKAKRFRKFEVAERVVKKFKYATEYFTIYNAKLILK
ncbi:MAG: hypothetical protein E6Q97_23265 [Desulfurellales bacterium]|nr:MAG: hypothetical protein E6Q97_23265 [Desulfurellales bacterium]